VVIGPPDPIKISSYYIPNLIFFNLIFHILSVRIPLPLPPLQKILCASIKKIFQIKFILWVTLKSLYNKLRRWTMAHWVKAGVVENRFEGDRVSQALKEAEIPFMIKSFHDTAYDGLYIPQKGWGVVMVPESLRAEAEKLLIEVKKIFQEEGKDETEQPG
jgi:hypothetical protein